MGRLIYLLCVVVIAATPAPTHAHHEPQSPKPAKPKHFLYDPAEVEVPPARRGSPDAYDSDLEQYRDQWWLAYLEFTPGKGDRVHVAVADGPDEATTVIAPTGRFRRPTLTRVGEELWLTYESFDVTVETWRVQLVCYRRTGDRFEWQPGGSVTPHTISAVDHAIAADPSGGAWLVWQQAVAGQYDVFACRIDAAGQAAEAELVSTNPAAGDWNPSVAVTVGGKVCVAWDTFRCDGFDIVVRWRDVAWLPPRLLAATAAFEGRARVVASTTSEAAWIAWEEGAPNWGQPYRGKWTQWNEITDEVGPLHRYRRVRLAQVNAIGQRRDTAPLPMPSFALAELRPDRRSAATQLGAFYERPELAVDHHDQPWVFFRHYYHPQSASTAPVIHHIEEGWRVQARRLDGDHWSSLYECSNGDSATNQRDGAQRLAVASAAGDGVACAFSVGRTDRRNDPHRRGLAWATLPSKRGSAPVLSEPIDLPLDTATTPPRTTTTRTVAGKTYQLVRGDLHRHTDLSLCFPFYDGSLDDVYRYAIEVAQHDFLGVTDHARDIAQGNEQAQLWWRTTKEVTRHHMPGHFHPFYSYERSRGETDHNVISLYDNLLRPHTTPHASFWQQLDADTLMIPHATFAPPSRPINPVTWRKVNDDVRPLVEIFQGCRDHSVEDDAHEGLNRGHHIGFIASSDHLSTKASYACAWVEQLDRTTIFRALQARRTFGATAPLSVAFHLGDHWMGERVVSDDPLEFTFAVQSPTPIARVTLIRDGRPVESRRLRSAASSFEGKLSAAPVLDRESWFYLHVETSDGQEAWSSPIWVR